MTISWTAPIVPSRSLAGIRLNTRVEELESCLRKYLVNQKKALYQFEGSPILHLSRDFDDRGSGGYGFEIDPALTNWQLYFDRPEHMGVNLSALAINVHESLVQSIKIWQFEHLKPGDRPLNSYQGKLPGGVGLGDRVRDLLPFTSLEFDSGEQWFYTDDKYGSLEIIGCGADVDLDQNPDQTISAICLI